jgi:peptidyl-prolyl cis-trans isomerase A (cyclophilin A)
MTGSSSPRRTEAAGCEPPRKDSGVTDTYATFHTTSGDIVVQLFPNHAPKTVRNFVGLADGTGEWTDEETGEKQVGKKFYDGLGFHRVIEGFMLQGGCPLGTGTGGPGYTFDDEIHPELQFSKPYLLAMANAGSRGGRGTNGSQFFITSVATPHLNGRHTIFGEVADQASRDVVDAVDKVPTDRGDRPLEPVTILAIDIEEL